MCRQFKGLAIERGRLALRAWWMRDGKAVLGYTPAQEEPDELKAIVKYAPVLLDTPSPKEQEYLNVKVKYSPLSIDAASPHRLQNVNSTDQQTSIVPNVTSQ